MLQRAFGRIVLVALLLLVLGGLRPRLLAQAPPDPTPDPGQEGNIFYGWTAQGAGNAPVIVFIHGLRGTASDWWAQGEGQAIDNDMFSFAFRARFRTAFVSLSPDNSRNDESIEDNAAVLTTAIPKIADRFGVEQVYAVAHSKGGLDLQSAMLDPAVRSRIKALFTVSTPNQGSALADWAFGDGAAAADLLDLLTPGIGALQTANVQALRAQIDPILEAEQIPVFTVAGRSPRGPLTGITGLLLQILDPGPSDGFVTVASAQLPRTYATEMGEMSANHFVIDRGGIIWPKIFASILGFEQTSDQFKRIATNGFDGDLDNTWNWSMAWFKDRLYVGTGRSVQCFTFATALVQVPESPIPLYPVPGNRCAPDYTDLALAAEIWAYTPETRVWEQVHQSPETVPIEFDDQDNPTKFTARDVGYRGMFVFEEQDGTEALYVAATTAASVYQTTDYYQNNDYPPPRILRSVDGVNFAPLPQDPGTFLGEILNDDTFGARGFRSFAELDGKLFVTGTDFRGLGFIIYSENPEQGNDAWARASGPVSEFPVWTLYSYNGFLYTISGDNQFPDGYEIRKTDATGPAPFTFTPIVTGGGFQSAEIIRARAGLSFGELDGILYAGSDRPTEMIRIFPDDSWDVVVGNPRDTPVGFKAPLSSIGQRFGNFFNGHFWRMKQSWDRKRLFMGTWDNSISSRTVQVLDNISRGQYGTDVYTTTDGVHWSFATKQGFGDPMNYGTRSLEATPFGTALGTAQATDGAQVWIEQSQLDFDADGDIDQNDVTILQAAVSSNDPVSGPRDPRDIDQDGAITANDVTKLQTQCDEPGCAVVTPDPNVVPAPKNLMSASIYVLPQAENPLVALNWDPVPGASRYRIYRSEVRPALELLPPGLEINFPGVEQPIRIPEDFLPGGLFDDFCTDPNAPENGDLLPCFLRDLFTQIDIAGVVNGQPLPFIEVGFTTDTSYTETAPTNLQSIYYVVADNSVSVSSGSSNVVGGPSYSVPVNFTAATDGIQRVQSNFANPEGAAALAVLQQADSAAQGSDYAGAIDLLAQERERLLAIESPPSGTIEIARLFTDLIGTLRFTQSGIYSGPLLNLGQ